MTAAEQRANAEGIQLGAFSPPEFDFGRFRGPEPFTLDLAALTRTYWEAGTALSANIGEVRELIRRELRAGRTVIGEFGQAYWLDKRHGFSPNVTASHTYTPEFFESAGIPVQRIHTFGVAKAYDTKVGTHTFLTRMDDAHPLAAKLKQIEFGTGQMKNDKAEILDADGKPDWSWHTAQFHDIQTNRITLIRHAREADGYKSLFIDDGSAYDKFMTTSAVARLGQ